MGNKRKIVVYQKTNSKPIIIHDESEKSIEELQNQLKDCFKSTTVQSFKTVDDILLIRPSEISSILITDENKGSNFYKTELDKDDSPKDQK
jgi:hypothetical protein